MLHVVLVDAGLDDGVHRAGFFAEAAVDALEEVDVVTRRAARAVVGNIRFDGDGERGAHGLAQLAGDAAFFAVRVATQRMQPTEARRLRGLLFRVVHRELARPQLLPGNPKATEQLPQGKCLEDVAHDQLTLHGPTLKYTITPSTAIQTIVTGIRIFQPRRMIWSYR